MARYYFHLHNDEDLVDEEGSEFADDASAIEHGRGEALAMAVASLAEHRHLVLSHHVIVTDHAGREVTAIRFSDVVQIRD
jgi:hypothetical protein